MDCVESRGVVALNRIAYEGRSRSAMKEEDFVHGERASEDDLIDFPGPGRGLFLGQLKIKMDFWPAFREAGRSMETGIREAFGPLG